MVSRGLLFCKDYLEICFRIIYVGIGFILICLSVAIVISSLVKGLETASDNPQDVAITFVSYIVVSAVIFDMGRYILQEEVYKSRELNSPKEARQSITKFMAIIIMAVTMEALLHLMRLETQSVTVLVYSAILFIIAILLLLSLGVYQRLSVIAELGEREIEDIDRKNQAVAIISDVYKLGGESSLKIFSRSSQSL